MSNMKGKQNVQYEGIFNSHNAGMTSVRYEKV